MSVLVLLALAAFSSSLSIRIIDPLVPEIARNLATSVGTVALLASAFAFPFALSQPILGPLGDALGKARLIKVCLGLLTAGLIATTFAPSIDVLFASRVLTGIASGGIVPLCFATVGDRFAMKDRQVALSRILSAILVGQLGGAVGAGLIASASSWRVVLGITALTAFTGFAFVARGLQPMPNAKRTPFTVERVLTSYGLVFANPRAVICFTAVFFEGMAIFGLLPYLAAMLEAKGAGSIREAGFVISGMAIGGILYTATVRVMLWHMNFMGLMRWGGLVCAAGLASLALLDPWPAKFVAFVAVGLGFYMIHNSIQTQVTELAPEARGASVALHAFCFFLGQATGPVLYGLGIGTIGAEATVSVSAGAMLLLGLATAHGFARRG
jgi:predicted MFS family arabinose efflux permease